MLIIKRPEYIGPLLLRTIIDEFLSSDGAASAAWKSIHRRRYGKGLF